MADTIKGRNLWELLSNRAGATPDKVMVRDDTGRALTFADYRVEAERAAAGLARNGIVEGDVVSWQLPTWIESMMLVGALAHSGLWRGLLSASMDQPHLIEGLDQVTRALGGLTAAWRSDRMATVVHPESGRVTASFAAVAKHYGVSVRPCPPRRGNRKGAVESSVIVGTSVVGDSLPAASVAVTTKLLAASRTRGTLKEYCESRSG